MCSNVVIEFKKKWLEIIRKKLVGKVIKQAILKKRFLTLSEQFGLGVCQFKEHRSNLVYHMRVFKTKLTLKGTIDYIL